MEGRGRGVVEELGGVADYHLPSARPCASGCNRLPASQCCVPPAVYSCLPFLPACREVVLYFILHSSTACLPHVLPAVCRLPCLPRLPACREIVLFFMVVNEVHSLYANVNAKSLGFTSIEGEGGREACHDPTLSPPAYKGLLPCWLGGSCGCTSARLHN